MSELNYKSAGVDIAAGNQTVKQIKQAVQGTYGKEVLTPLGSFAAMYDLKSLLQDYEHPCLVQSIDGVGTKTIVARLANRYDTLGFDLLSATANDILTLGAKPLTLLDYVANDKLNPDIVTSIVHGIAKACKTYGVALVGGETAEMPDTYLPGEHDLVGIVTGVVEKNKAITGAAIQQGDVILGFGASGLHTNGYSLARKIIFEHCHLNPDDNLLNAELSVADALLAPHINYAPPVLDILATDFQINGMAHITGGGLLENIPRILPQGLAANINLSSWPNLPIFEFLTETAKLANDEAYKTFNMGIGYVLIVPADVASSIQEHVANKHGDYQLYQIGEITSGANEVTLS